MANYRRLLIEEGIATQEELVEIEKDVDHEIEKGLEFARNSPDPKAQDYELYVYSEE